ncbi:MAG: sulfur globule protein CV3 [Gammaproteobacteria bacterium]|nr:sulfur globule protein CV3 [Gammaproteobacteria bacterium]MDJ0870687.1 sulfur globule protein CV3 [Gammaproteobacteria bacterium]
MKKISVILAAAVVAGSALLPLQSANAFFGGGPWWGGYGWGGYGWGGGPWGWGGPYGWGGYPGYGWGGYPGYGWGGYPGWGGYGYPYAMTAPVIVQQPATAKK